MCKGLEVWHHSHQGDITVTEGPQGGDYEMRVERKLESVSKGPFVMKYFKRIFKNRNNSIINPHVPIIQLQQLANFVSSLPTLSLITHTRTHTHRETYFEANPRHRIISCKRIFNLCHSDAIPPWKSLTQIMPFSLQYVLNIAVLSRKFWERPHYGDEPHALEKLFQKKQRVRQSSTDFTKSEWPPLPTLWLEASD